MSNIVADLLLPTHIAQLTNEKCVNVSLIEIPDLEGTSSNYHLSEVEENLNSRPGTYNLYILPN